MGRQKLLTLSLLSTLEQRVKYLLAKFISSSARIISEPFFFSLRGNCKKGLLRHLGLSPKVYTALLLALDWVEFNKKGVKGLRSNIRSTFFDNASLNLRGAGDKPNSGISEILSIKVPAQSCMQHTGNLSNCNKNIHTHAIRIGAYGTGFDNVVIRASEEISGDRPPPTFANSQRTIQSGLDQFHGH